MACADRCRRRRRRFPRPCNVACASGGWHRHSQSLAPDAVIILGDRYEMLATASAAAAMHIPIVHIAGGRLLSVRSTMYSVMQSPNSRICILLPPTTIVGVLSNGGGARRRSQYRSHRCAERLQCPEGKRRRIARISRRRRFGSSCGRNISSGHTTPPHRLVPVSRLCSKLWTLFPSLPMW